MFHCSLELKLLYSLDNIGSCTATMILIFGGVLIRTISVVLSLLKCTPMHRTSEPGEAAASRGVLPEQTPGEQVRRRRALKGISCKLPASCRHINPVAKRPGRQGRKDTHSRTGQPQTESYLLRGCPRASAGQPIKRSRDEVKRAGRFLCKILMTNKGRTKKNTTENIHFLWMFPKSYQFHRFYGKLITNRQKWPFTKSRIIVIERDLMILADIYCQ